MLKNVLFWLLIFQILYQEKKGKKKIDIEKDKDDSCFYYLLNFPASRRTQSELLDQRGQSHYKDSDISLFLINSTGYVTNLK